MIRVHVICEGQTEEMFVNEILAEALRAKGIELYPSLVGKPGHKGGNFKYERLFSDIEKRLLKDTTSYCTAFFDFYGLPESFPGKKEANKLTATDEKARHMRTALIEKLTSNLGEETVRRFIPYIQMYEFEGLLFSNPESLAISVGCDNTVGKFQAIRDDLVSLLSSVDGIHVKSTEAGKIPLPSLPSDSPYNCFHHSPI